MDKILPCSSANTSLLRSFLPCPSLLALGRTQASGPTHWPRYYFLYLLITRRAQTSAQFSTTRSFSAAREYCLQFLRRRGIPHTIPERGDFGGLGLSDTP